MPGIIPMKVIKVGNSAQTRIAQACDRCRSKKIRCDGFRPSCSQCSQVGFDCKTSDKLSRRAFPRGYTESLEERVRLLEGETKELKDLLDAKDEKIDILSRMQSNSPPAAFSSRRPSIVAKSPPSSVGRPCSSAGPALQSYQVQQPQSLNTSGAQGDLYYRGTSSGQAFADSLKQRINEAGGSAPVIDSEDLFPANASTAQCRPAADPATFWKAPPRMVSDQVVNIFFQEWAPLFPILHKPTFLGIYERYVGDMTAVRDNHDLAQLHLVFGIAAISSNYDVEACERQWMTCLSPVLKYESLKTLQCLLLAQLYCMQKGDHSNLLHYKSLSVGLCLRLGLHQPQRHFHLDALTAETRKKNFWTLYTLDSFSAAVLGLPRLLREDFVGCEYPVNVDDDNITDHGFQPTLPGDFTRISSALALFHGTRILSRVLDYNFPSTSSHDVSLAQINELDHDLEDWLQNLPAHLKLAFEQERPSSRTISSRCPFLSLTYHYIRTLIHRPAACASAAHCATSSVVIVAASSKAIIQIIELLDERNLCFSHCMNRNETLLSAGCGLLFQSLDLAKDSKILKDLQRSACAVIDMLERSCAPAALSFKRVGYGLLSIRKANAATEGRLEEGQARHAGSPPPIFKPPRAKTQTEIAPLRRAATTKANEVKASWPPQSTPSEVHIYQRLRQLQQQNLQTQRLAAARHRHSIATPNIARAEMASIAASSSDRDVSLCKESANPPTSLNLDYFNFGSNEPPPAHLTPSWSSSLPGDTEDWDDIVLSLASEPAGTSMTSPTQSEHLELSSRKDAVASPAMAKASRPNSFENVNAWTPDEWNLPTDLLAPISERGSKNISRAATSGPQSVFSLSDDSLTSNEDGSGVDLGNIEGEAFKAFMQNTLEEDKTPYTMTAQPDEVTGTVSA